jgi:hypothetical protein
LRINFEVSGHRARRGLYVVRYPGGDILTSWNALDGWTDSGWISIPDLPRETVWVEVLYYPGPNAAPTTMRVVNHAPGTSYGWVSRNMAHALEVAWPDMPLRQQMTPMRPDGEPWPSYSVAWRRPPGMGTPPYGMMGRPFDMMIGPPGRPR